MKDKRFTMDCTQCETILNCSRMKVKDELWRSCPTIIELTRTVAVSGRAGLRYSPPLAVPDADVCPQTPQAQIL
jgi:hypothetical protein